MRYQESDGYVDNVVLNKDVAEDDDTLYRIALAWEPTNSLTIAAKFSHVESNARGIEQVNNVIDPSLLAGFGTNDLKITDVMGSIAAFAVPGYLENGTRDYKSWTANPGFGLTDREDTESNQASIKIDWELDNYLITSLTGYTDFELQQQQDVDFNPGNTVQNFESEKLDTFSQEFRIASNYDGFFNFSAGVYYEEQDLTVSQFVYVDGTLGGVFGALPASALNPALPPIPLSSIGINSLWNGQVFASLNPAAAPLIGAEQDVIWRSSNNDNNNDTIAGFVELTFNLTDSLFLDLGGRYSVDTKKTHKTGITGVNAPSSAASTLRVIRLTPMVRRGQAQSTMMKLHNPMKWV